MTTSTINWKKYLYEFLTIFIGVTLAFALTKWNEDNNRYESSEKTLLEISNGLTLDLGDFKDNRSGHEQGVYLCGYFRDYLNDKPINRDSMNFYYQSFLRDYISIQNKSGYESLKAKGLELVEDDELRVEIISLYDFYYEIIEKLEENYAENQFTTMYFESINNMLAEYMIFDENGRLIDLTKPTNLSKKERNLLMSYLWKVESNRQYTIRSYRLVEDKITQLIKHIEDTVNK